MIQKKYSEWAAEKGLNKWLVLGRISYETGMYKFKSDESRRTDCKSVQAKFINLLWLCYTIYLLSILL